MDRRRQERYPLDVPIRIIPYDDGISTVFEASSRDISSKGVFIKTDKIRLESRQKVHLELTLTIDKLKELFGYPRMVTLEVDGAVVRTLQEGIVVEFEDKYSIVPVEMEG